MKRAATLLVLGRPQAAVRELEEAKAGGDPVGALLLGRAYLEMKEPKKAAEAFKVGLGKAKGDFDLTTGAIEAQREGGDAAGALKESQALEKKHSDRADSAYQVGASLEAMGDYGRAMDMYEEGLERDASHAPTLFRLAYNHELRGSMELAEDYYKRCAALNPTYSNALVNYGLMLEDTPEDGAVWAVERLRRALGTKPGSRTVRAGVACYPGQALTPSDLVDAARAAYAAAKEWPQDRIEVAIAEA